ncbi:MAG: phosphoribosylanthranilate isomerase [Thermoproteota archaeon]
MSQVRVKICGITSQKDLDTAVQAGADAVGFVVGVPQSKRNLSIHKADTLIESTPVFVDSVVVTVPKDPYHLRKICEEVTPTSIQIHGGKNLYKDIGERRVNTRMIGAIKAKDGLSEREIVRFTRLFDAVLIDSHVPGKHGGTGRVHDWGISKRVRDLLYPKPLVLAGGLSPDNVKEAIQTVRPYAVDVSTGVEKRPGIKDPEKVTKFIKKTKEV